MLSYHSKYFVYRELKRAPQKVSFCFKWPDTEQHTVPIYALPGTLTRLNNVQEKKYALTLPIDKL